jgi:hypothetical protein
MNGGFAAMPQEESSCAYGFVVRMRRDYENHFARLHLQGFRPPGFIQASKAGLRFGRRFRQEIGFDCAEIARVGEECVQDGAWVDSHQTTEQTNGSNNLKP